jgi:NitT/TauT family transport system permease protein
MASSGLDVIREGDELSEYRKVAAAETGGRSRRRRHSRIPKQLLPGYWLPAVVGIGLLVLAWQLVAVHNPYIIPSVGSIARELVHNRSFYWRNGLITLQETAVGIGCSSVIAIATAVLMVQSRLVERALMPLIVIMHLTPLIAIAPGLVIAFGFGMTPKYIVAALIVFFPVVINALIGLRSADPQALDLLQTVRASRLEVLFRVRLPSSVPYLCAAARIAFPVGLIGAIVAEFTASGNAKGLGSAIEVAASNADLKEIYAATVCLTVMGLVLTFIVVTFEARLMRWYSGTERG